MPYFHMILWHFEDAKVASWQPGKTTELQFCNCFRSNSTWLTENCVSTTFPSGITRLKGKQTFRNPHADEFQFGKAMVVSRSHYLAQEHYPAHSRMAASAANRFVKPSCPMLGIPVMQEHSKSCWNDESSFGFVVLNGADLPWLARSFYFLSCLKVLLALICRSPPLFLGCSFSN